MGRPSRPDEGRVEIAGDDIGGVHGEWLRPARPGRGSGAAILYLHGGGYCLGSPATHRAITVHLARASGSPVFAAEYRLAPEHPFPAAVEDAVSVCRALLDRGPLVIAGDSAGAGLASAAALALRRQHTRKPAALVLLSPWIDLTLPAIAERSARREAMVSHRWLAACARHYIAGADPKAPTASPIYGDLRGLPPTLIQAGADELLQPDAVRLHDALVDAGVAVCCELVPDHWHAFQLHAGILAAADAALERAGAFIARQLASPAGGETITAAAQASRR